MRRRNLLWAAGLLAIVGATVAPSPASAAPANDQFASAVDLGAPVRIISNNIGASVEPGENLSCAQIGSTVWYRITPPDLGLVTITTISPSSNFDTVIALYSGDSLSNLSQTRCNDDQGASARSATTQLLAIAPYYLQVGGFGNQQGQFELQISFRRSSDARDCSASTNHFAQACLRGSGAGAWQGAQATWASNTLNISQDGAHSGGWIEQAVWFNNEYTSQTNHTWLEIGDTAGTHNMENNPNAWERWYFWVDGTRYNENPRIVRELGIEPSPNDGASRAYIIQWDGPVDGWGLYICPGACFRKANVSWIAPSSMSNQTINTGLEVSPYMINANTNSAVFQDSTMKVQRLSDAQWVAWPSAQIQHDSGCGHGYGAPFCLNGVWLNAPPPHDNWRNNKPE